jgi:YihY family inner membrane protein
VSTAAPVPETYELEGDDALASLREVGLGALLRDSFIRFRAADGFSHSRALAFQLMLTLLPSLIAIVALARELGQETFTRILTDTVEDVAPGPASEVLTQAFEQGSESSSGGLALAAGLIVAIVSATTAMGQIERGSNRIYGVERDRPGVRKYGLALALACSAGLATAIAFVALVPGSALGHALKEATGWSDGLDTSWAVGRWVLGSALVALAVTLLFRVAPNRSQPSESWLALGSAIAVGLWFAFTGLLAAYVGLAEGFGETYGPLAGVIGLLIWALLTALALFGGLAVSAQLEAVRAGSPGPQLPFGRRIDSAHADRAQRR